LEAHPTVYRTTNASSFIPEKISGEKYPTLLGFNELPLGMERKLYCMGAQSRESLLGYERNILSGADTKKLG